MEIAKFFVIQIASNSKDLALIIKFGEECGKEDSCCQSLQLFLDALIIGIAKARGKTGAEMLVMEMLNKVRFYASEGEAGEREAEETARR